MGLPGSGATGRASRPGTAVMALKDLARKVFTSTVQQHRKHDTCAVHLKIVVNVHAESMVVHVAHSHDSTVGAVLQVVAFNALF